LQAPVLSYFTWRLHEVTGSVDWEVPHEDEKFEGASTLRLLRPRSTEQRSFKASRLNLATR
jgi:hypothetical protein